MSTFLSSVFKQAELTRLEHEAARDEHAIYDASKMVADARYIFEHDEPLPRVDFEVLPGNQILYSRVRIDGQLYTDADTYPQIELARWMAAIGLTPSIWKGRRGEPLNLRHAPVGHPHHDAVRAYLATGWPLPDVADGQGSFGCAVLINDGYFSYGKSWDHEPYARDFTDAGCPLWGLASWMIECKMAGIWMG